MTPSPDPALPWGSRSMRRVRRSAAAKDAARFTAVVVFPTPPFWFEMERILGTNCSFQRPNRGAGGPAPRDPSRRQGVLGWYHSPPWRARVVDRGGHRATY